MAHKQLYYSIAVACIVSSTIKTMSQESEHRKLVIHTACFLAGAHKDNRGFYSHDVLTDKAEPIDYTKWIEIAYDFNKAIDGKTDKDNTYTLFSIEKEDLNIRRVTHTVSNLSVAVLYNKDHEGTARIAFGIARMIKQLPGCAKKTLVFLSTNLTSMDHENDVAANQELLLAIMSYCKKENHVETIDFDCCRSQTTEKFYNLMELCFSGSK